MAQAVLYHRRLVLVSTFLPPLSRKDDHHPPRRLQVQQVRPVNMAQFITRLMIRMEAMYKHPDMHTGYTWAQMQKLLPYHGELRITLAVMNKN